MTTLVAIIHAGLAAAWVGGMTYSLFVVQPKVKKYFGPDEDSREALTW
jgi:putative copper export protein